MIDHEPAFRSIGLQTDAYWTQGCPSTKGNEKLNVSAVNSKIEQPKTNGLPLSKEFDKKETDWKEAGCMLTIEDDERGSMAS